MDSQPSRQQAGRTTSWHDGMTASHQSFTVKDWPKHRLGETSDELFALRTAPRFMLNHWHCSEGTEGQTGMLCRVTE